VAPTLLKRSIRSDWSADAPVFVPKVNFKTATHANSSNNVSHHEPASPSADVCSYVGGETPVTSEDNVVTGDNVDGDRCRAFDHSFQQRTLIMKGLPDRATLFDVVKAIQGGQLLSFYIRPREKFARISFVEASAAEAFFVYSKRAAVYVRGKQVSSVNLNSARRRAVDNSRLNSSMMTVRAPCQAIFSTRSIDSAHLAI
jgi:hypothetical protein